MSAKELSVSSQRKIFISHRHDDARIASALRKQLQSWGIPEDCIFQSSSNKQSGKIGHSINEGIRQFLEEAKLVILIYTHPEMNWDYCMYECGLATNPGTVQTNVIVFQCTASQPRVFKDELLIYTDYDGISRFTHQFHRKNDFFPGLPPYAPDFGEEGMSVRSNSLFDALKPLLPSQEARNDIRWGYFTLFLSPEIKSAIKKPDSLIESYEACKGLHGDILISSAEGFGLRHFGYQEYEPYLSLEKVIQRWHSNICSSVEEGNSARGMEWITELEMEICRSVRNDSPQILWSPLKSVYPHIDWLVCPVINEIRYKSDGSVELVIFMYRVDGFIKAEKGFFRKT